MIRTTTLLSFAVLTEFTLSQAAYSAIGASAHSSEISGRLRALLNANGSTVCMNNGARLSKPSLEKAGPKPIGLKPSKTEEPYKKINISKAEKDKEAE